MSSGNHLQTQNGEKGLPVRKHFQQKGAFVGCLTIVLRDGLNLDVLPCQNAGTG